MAYLPGQYRELARLLGANMNSTSDQAITIKNAPKYIIDKIIVTNASTSLTLATGGFYTATSKGGTTIVAAAQVYSALTAASKYLGLTLALTTDSLTAQTLYLSLTTAQGAAATSDVYIYGFVIN